MCINKCDLYNMVFNIMKNFIILILISVMLTLPAMAKDGIKVNAKMATDFSINENTPEIIKFMPGRKITTGNGTKIQPKSIITAEVYQSQKEKRWHKSGFIICKLISYTEPNSTEEIDLSQEEIYLVIRKYESINPKEAAITGTEITATTIASIFLPGVDVAYFFTKGAIQREKNSNWFKAGVSNAYDNSIFWFCLKGQPVNLQTGDDIKIVSIKKNKAENIKYKADKKIAKTTLKQERKAAKIQEKIKKAETKQNSVTCLDTRELSD